MSGDRVLDIVELNVTYPGPPPVRAVDGISLSVASNSIVKSASPADARPCERTDRRGPTLSTLIELLFEELGVD